MTCDRKVIRDLILLTLGWVTTTALFFAYILLSTGKLENIYKAWDGPSYVIAAKSLYRPELAAELNTIRSVAITPTFTFLPAHLPLYPMLIRLFSFVDSYHAMLSLTLLANLAFVFSFYGLARFLKLNNPLLLATTILVLPPRYFIVSHTGSSEPLFLAFLTLSLYYYLQSRSFASAGLAALAMATRPQGALLGLGYGILALYDLWSTRRLYCVIRRYWVYLVIPTVFALICLFYYHQTGDYWAFFHSLSIFHHFTPKLFPAFHFGAPNIETFWHEGSVLYYLIYAYAIVKLLAIKQIRLAFITMIFYLPLLFLQHSDISRYSLSLLPMTIIAFHELFGRKDFITTAIILLPATILYGADFIQYNRAP